jgi:hypothetical protein
MCFCPVLDGDGADTYSSGGQAESFSDQRPDFKVEIRYTPLSSTPQAKSFPERERVALAAEVIQVEPSDECTSSKLVVGLRIFADFPMLRLTLD